MSAAMETDRLAVILAAGVSYAFAILMETDALTSRRSSAPLMRHAAWSGIGIDFI
jgi:hypothetical protein